MQLRFVASALVILGVAGCSGPLPVLARSGSAQLLPFRLGINVTDPIDAPRHVSEWILFRRAEILTGNSTVIRNGYLLIRNGKIESLGSGDMQPPEGAQIVDAAGRFLTPGLIDTHSHMGVYPIPAVSGNSDGNEGTDPNTAQVRAEDSIWPQDPSFERAVAGGVTTVQILPGSANLIGGTGVTVKLHPTRTSSAMRFPGAPRGLKMACGENPKRVYGKKGRTPKTRMGSMALRRGYFRRAKERAQLVARYNRQVRLYNEGRRRSAPERPEPNPALDSLAGAISGEILVHMHCYRADEMARMLETAREFGFRIRSFHHAVEAYKVRDLLAREGTAASVWVDWWGFKMEAHDAIPENAALLSEAGARAIIHSDSESDVQRLNQEAARAFYAGQAAGIRVTEEQALGWVTLAPAWALGIDAYVGSLEKGKHADVVLWSQHPFSVYARPDLVFIDGVRRYDRSQARGPWNDFEQGVAP